MYAAAGGAALSSRKARQRQEKKKQTTKSSKATDILPKPIQKGQFHNYTDHNLPVLSSKNVLKPPEVKASDRRHSTSNFHHLRDSVASSGRRIRESPSICIPVHHHNHREPHQPLTPSTLVQNHLPLPISPSVTSQLPQILIPEGDASLERRCSFVRQVEEQEKFPEGGTGVLDRCHHMCNFEIKEKEWENNPVLCSEYEKSLFGSLDYPFSECSQGRAAWQERERGRRCSLSEEARQQRLKQTEAHHRWMKRNRIHDTTFGGSSEEEDFFDVYHQSAAANALLYVGLGTTAIGSVIFFVGTGEKGFKTLELRLIGPTLIACGLLCCLIRVLLCACPSKCLRRRKKTRLKNECPHSASSKYPLNPDRAPRRTDSSTTAPVEKHKKKVSIVTSNHNHPIPSTSNMNFQEERAELLPRETRVNIIPTITIPEDDNSYNKPMRTSDSLIELDQLNYDLQSISSSSNDSETVIEVECRGKASKLLRTREPALLSTSVYIPDDDGPLHETSLSVPAAQSEPSATNLLLGAKKTTSHAGVNLDRKTIDSDRKEPHSGILLSPLQLGQ